MEDISWQYGLTFRNQQPSTTDRPLLKVTLSESYFYLTFDSINYLRNHVNVSSDNDDDK